MLSERVCWQNERAATKTQRLSFCDHVSHRCGWASLFFAQRIAHASPTRAGPRTPRAARRPQRRSAPLPPPDGIDANVAYVAQIAAESLHAKAIIIHTTTGGTARRVACYRPKIPILGLSSFPESRRRLALTWGVESALVEFIRGTEHMVSMAFQQVTSKGLADPGDLIVITAGTPYGTAGRTNLLKVEEIPTTFADE